VGGLRATLGAEPGVAEHGYTLYRFHNKTRPARQPLCGQPRGREEGLLQPGQEVRCYGLYTYGYDSPATGLFRERRVPGEWQELADVSKVGHLGALLFLT
jgi:hypothetical protein